MINSHLNHSAATLFKDRLTLSTPALNKKFPRLFHFNANIRPLCCPNVFKRRPATGKNIFCYKSLYFTSIVKQVYTSLSR